MKDNNSKANYSVKRTVVVISLFGWLLITDLVPKHDVKLNGNNRRMRKALNTRWKHDY